MNATVEGAATLGEMLAATLALRRRSSSRYRQLAIAPEGNGQSARQQAFSRLAVSEAEFAARIESALTGFDVDFLSSERIGWTAPDVPAGLSLPDAPAEALAIARYNEKRMRAVFEHLAVTSPVAAVRMRALEMALAETRHLSSIEKLLAPLQTGS